MDLMGVGRFRLGDEKFYDRLTKGWTRRMKWTKSSNAGFDVVWVVGGALVATSCRA